MAASLVHIVLSNHNPDVTYQVTPDSCQCSAWYWGHMKDRTYHCKHQASAFGINLPTAICCRCGMAYPYTDASLQTRLLCPDCRRTRIGALAGALAVVLLCAAILLLCGVSQMQLDAGHGWNQISSTAVQP